MSQTAKLEIKQDRRIENWLRNVAYRLAASLARFLVRRGYFEGLRSNLSVIYGLPEESEALEQLVIDNLRNALVCYVDFFIVACRGPDAIDETCALDPIGLQRIKDHQAQGRGVVLVAPHTSSLDVFMLAMSRYFPDMQALSLSEPPLNTRIMNRLRGKYGMQLTPITSSSLRQAIRHLRKGGIVGIAADVPTPHGAMLSLFGKPCRLPIGHTRIAAATNSAIVVGISERIGPGQYRGFGIEVPSEGDDEEDWAAATLRVLERHILARPQEWFMPPPLWPAQEEGPVLFHHHLPPSLTSRLFQG